jgi:RHS repeat-associated protein
MGGRDSGVDLRILRRHTTRVDDPRSPFGPAWSFNYRQVFSMTSAGSDLVFTGFGRTDEFAAFGTWPSTPTSSDPWRWDGQTGRLDRAWFYEITSTTGMMVVRRPNGTRLFFSADLEGSNWNGQLTEVRSPNGNSISITHLKASGGTPIPVHDQRIETLVDSFGREIVFSYDANAGGSGLERVVSIASGVSGQSLREWTYAYGSGGELTSVTTPASSDYPSGKSTRYTYRGLSGVLEHALTSVKFPREVASGGAARLQWRYYETGDYEGFVHEHDVGDGTSAGGTFSYVYTSRMVDLAIYNVDPPNTAVMDVVVTDRRGVQVEVEMNATGQMLSEEVLDNLGLRGSLAPASAYKRVFEYTPDGLLESETKPLGNVVSYTYPTGERLTFANQVGRTIATDSTRVSDQSTIAWTTLYEPVFNRKWKVTDPRGNTTTYIYDYMENLTAAEPVLAAAMGFTVAELQAIYPTGFASTGEKNDDGTTSQFCGNLIRIDHPAVNLEDEATLLSLGLTTTPPQEANVRMHYNAYGQRTRRYDEEGNATDWTYFQTSSPASLTQSQIFNEVAGITTSASATGGGYVAGMVADSVSGSGRNSGTNPTPVQQTTAYAYGSVGSFPANYYGVPTKVVDPRGVETHFHVNAHDQVLEEIRAAAVPTSGPYSGLAALSYSRQTDYDENDQVEEVRVEDAGNPAGTSGWIRTTYAYDLLDFVTEIRRDAGSSDEIVTTYEYDESTNRTAMVAGAGASEASRSEWTYDERNLVITERRGAGGSLTGEDAVTVTKIDENGNVVELVDASAGGVGGAKTTPTTLAGDSTFYTYDGFDRLRVVVDRVGTQTTRTYDPASNIEREVVHGVIHFYSSSSAAIDLSRVDWRYDERNRMVREDRELFDYASGGTTYKSVGNTPGSLTDSSTPTVAFVTVYDRAGRVIGSIDSETDVTEMHYDGLGRPIETIDPIGNTVESFYDPSDNLFRIDETDIATAASRVSTDESFTTLLEHDALGRRTKLIEENGQETEFEYDSRDNLVRTIDELGNVVECEHDRFDRLITKTTYLSLSGVHATPSSHSDEIVLRQEWDDLHRLVLQRDANGNETEYGYDDLGRLVSQTYGDLTTAAWTYNADGELLTHTDQTGYEWRWQHDAEGRPTATLVEEPTGLAADDKLVFNGLSGTGAAQFQWRYDDLGRVWCHEAANSALPIDDVLTEVWHDSLGRAVREIQSIGGVSTTVDYGWEGARRLTTMVYPSGPGGTEREVEFAYDALDRLVEADDTLGTTPIAAMEYIGSARLALLEYRNGCELDKTGGTGSTLGHGYDPNRRHVNHEWKRGSTVITSYHNTYNGTNRRTSETRSHVSPAETDSYTFDSAYRMVGFDRAGAAAASTRKLDGADKMGTYSDEGTTVVTVIDGDVAEAGLNQYSSFAGSARTYNPNGSLVRTSTRRYEYDVANRLWAVNDTSGGGSTTIAKYCHDALNRRVVKMEFSGGVMTAKTRFVYAGWQVVEELEADLTTTPETWNARRQYVTGSRLDDHLQMVTYSGTGSSLAVADTYYYHGNSQGFVGALTDASGTRVETYEYKWLGEPLSTSSVGNRYLWQGRYWDEDLEWYYFRNRNYEPATGEFTTIDPSGLWRHGQGNGYSAFGAAEWVHSDPEGLRIVIPNDEDRAEFLNALEHLCPCYGIAIDSDGMVVLEIESPGEECLLEACLDQWGSSCSVLRELVESPHEIRLNLTRSLPRYSPDPIPDNPESGGGGGGGGDVYWNRKRFGRGPGKYRNRRQGVSPEATLWHELLHALHHSRTSIVNGSDTAEEHRTVREENVIRREHHVPARDHYGTTPVVNYDGLAGIPLESPEVRYSDR